LIAPELVRPTRALLPDVKLVQVYGLSETGHLTGLQDHEHIGYRDADGYSSILDRLKDMVVKAGENVYCGEVEAVSADHPAVREVAVFGIPDPQWENSCPLAWS
jgi:acyl-coenzyme A synthetase/AMP-(fatty) acid ligase